jgi:glycine cleavage system regulatory protein
MTEISRFFSIVIRPSKEENSISKVETILQHLLQSLKINESDEHVREANEMVHN